MTTLQEAAQAVAGHIQKPYTEQEIAEQIKSGCYDAELMLQHLLRLYMAMPKDSMTTIQEETNNKEALECALRLLAANPKRAHGSFGVKWINEALLMGPHCMELEDVTEAALRIVAEELKRVTAALERWESEIGKVMPKDCKDYWQNDPAERPMVTRLLIESLRERERMAWEQTCFRCQGVCSRNGHCKGPVKRVVVTYPGTVGKWGPYYYCQQAIEKDTRNGYEVKEVEE